MAVFVAYEEKTGVINAAVMTDRHFSSGSVLSTPPPPPPPPFDTRVCVNKRVRRWLWLSMYVKAELSIPSYICTYVCMLCVYYMLLCCIIKAPERVKRERHNVHSHGDTVIRHEQTQFLTPLPPPRSTTTTPPPFLLR